MIRSENHKTATTGKNEQNKIITPHQIKRQTWTGRTTHSVTKDEHTLSV